MNKNQIYTAECEDITDQGYGVVHIDGKTVFVRNLLPGEKAEIQVIKPFKKYAIARVVRRLTDSVERTQPRCRYAEQCGGCSFMHMDYQAQLAYKQRQLQELFSHVSPDIQVEPVLGMKEPYHYRNKAQFPVQTENGKIKAGFYKVRSNDIVDMDNCLIQDPRINEVFYWIRQHLPLKTAENLRHIFIRCSRKTGQMQVAFISRSREGLDAFAAQLKKAFPAVTSILYNENLRSDNVILGEKYEVLEGSDSILEECLGLKIKLHFKSFFQVNPEQMEVLYTKALEMADLKPDDTVIELYAGTGTIGMLASRQCREVIGVEIVQEAVDNAMENVKLNHISNASYVCQDATDFAAENVRKADVLIVDPPRKGMTTQGIQDICTLEPEKVVYISCNPRTLARDLELFMKQGYECPVIQPVDMFAHSNNIECIALLNRKDQMISTDQSLSSDE